MDFIDETVYSPEMSAGGINAFYMPGCDHVGHRPSYAICLNKIGAYRRDGKVSDIYNCGQQIACGLCPALRLQAEEKAAGRAIYFIHRDKLREFREQQEAANRPGASTAARRDPNTMKFPDEVNLARGLPTDHVDHFHTAKGKAYAPAPKANTGGLTTHSNASYADAINAAIAESSTTPKTATPKKVESPVPTQNVPFAAGMSLLELAKARLAASSQQ